MPLKLPKGVFPPPTPYLLHIGKVLFIYSEIYTQQVIYSLYRHMKNSRVMKQLTFVGKKSVARALRKDRWEPLACVHFPTPTFGLYTYRLLREFRKMHETQYDKSLLKLPKRERGFLLKNQKANSIADLAESLQLTLNHFKTSTKNLRLDPDAEIVIKWQDMHDGENAREWPAEVKHMKGARPDRYAFSEEDLPAELQEGLLLDRENLRKLESDSLVDATPPKELESPVDAQAEAERSRLDGEGEVGVR